jgi:CubicO group peptidase (beta-lactamase class C family)
MKNRESLHQIFKQREAANKFSGVVLITRTNQEIYSAAFGYASRAWKIRNTLNTRFDTASITKLFTTVAILQMIDKNLLSFDTGVVGYLDLVGTKISNEVNVYHLLTHTSGIGDDCEEEDGELYEDLWKTKPNYSVRETRDFLPQFIDKEPNFAPGKGCRYCNCSFILLGLMIEKSTGLSYRDYVREYIFRKANMSHSDFFDLGQVNEDIAEGCDPIFNDHGEITGWKRNIYSFPTIGSPDSGAYVTAGDLDRFLRSIHSGKFLSQELTTDLLKPHAFYREKDGWTMKYGFCFWFYMDKDEKIVCYQKEGTNAGVSSVMRYFPEQDINVIILSNMEDGVWEPIWEIHEMIVAGKFD